MSSKATNRQQWFAQFNRLDCSNLERFFKNTHHVQMIRLTNTKNSILFTYNYYSDLQILRHYWSSFIWQDPMEFWKYFMNTNFELTLFKIWVAMILILKLCLQIQFFQKCRSCLQLIFKRFLKFCQTYISKYWWLLICTAPPHPTSTHAQKTLENDIK